MPLPKRVFIVPYRNRQQHKFFFSKYMSFILEDCHDYEIYFSHQCDSRTFNRGAMKNIGFLAIKEKYPDNYKDITFIFNDVDTLPFNKIFDYQTTPGILKHYYGFEYALGGIVVMKGKDFENINGFPCFWGWGMEDNVLQKRCLNANLIIDRKVFYKIGSPEILQLFDGISRIISRKDPWRMDQDTGLDGISTIHNLEFAIDDKSINPNDNIFPVHNDRLFVINVSRFFTYVNFESQNYYNYDIREPQRAILSPRQLKERPTKHVATTDTWSNIPYYPTEIEKKEDYIQACIESGKPVPTHIAIELDMEKKVVQQKDSFNNTRKQHIPHKYSSEYASYIGHTSKAQTSVRVGLGGIIKNSKVT